jgi:hypothetical protein
MSASSLVVLRGQEFVRGRDADEQIREFAELTGLKFIKLHHISPEYAAHPYTVKGWQAAEIIVGSSSGEKKYTVRYTKHPDTGKDCESSRNLSFVPKSPTGILEAELVDTPFNRTKLARCYYYGAQWKILDVAIDKEVKAMADQFEIEYAEKRKNEPTKDDIIVRQDAEKQKLLEENARLQRELTAKNETDKVVTAAKKSKGGRPKKNEASIDKEREIENEIKAQVFNEKKDLIAEIQKKYKQFWLSIEYRQQIYPEIQRRLAERLKNANVNTGTGVDNKG